MVAPRKKRQTTFSRWWLILLLLPIAGVGLGLWFGWSRQQVVNLDYVATLLPQTTEVLCTVDMTPQAWSFVHKSVAPSAREVLAKSLDRLPVMRMVQQAGLDWQRHVQPWSRGMVGLALLGSSQDESTAVAVLIPAQSTAGAKDFIRRYQGSWSQSEERSYEGIIYQQNSNPDRSEVVALVKDAVVIASHPQALFQIIDVAQNRQPALAALAVWQSSSSLKLQTETTDRLLLHGLVRQNTNLFADKTRLKEPEAFSFALTTLPQGLHVKFQTYFRNPLPPISDRESKLVALLPAQTFFYVSGWQLRESWLFFTNVFADQTKITEWRNSLLSEAGLDLEQDVFGWMQGEWGIAGIPTQTGVLGKTTGFGLVFLAEGGRQASQRFFEQLDNLAVNSQGGLLPKGVTLQGKNDRTLWLVGKSVAASHGAVGGYNFWAMGELGDQIKFNNSLLSDAKWQRSVAGLPQTNGGYFYLDMGVARALFSNNIAPPEWQAQDWFKETMAILNSIDAITFTQTRVDDRTTRLEGQIILSPVS
ncbi:MAG: DUF3352 domain-containing protein [Pseudanabaenaceae cyanobacterium SKYGB_i_bin29]|nr:DUF3352 domain-containing protein [Pseudanabaenaceae cyanobacterium SKYG29]MDW8420881.1 DUF3352 domain-containing protein [Pseudanabaenaceae cyanobacterium SKYGB_i_bin29]